MPRLSRKQRTPAAPSIDEHNRVLRLAEARALKLEDRLVAILEPILNRAGEEAATAFSRMATDHLGAAGQPGVKSTSTMICLKPTPEEAGRIAKQGGLDASTLHVTLAYLGDVEGDLEPVVAAIRAAAAVTAPLRGVVGGVGLFAPGPDGAPVIALPDVPGLVELRVKVTEALVEAGIGYSRDHGFCAHMTLDYTPTVESGFDGDMPFGEPLTFDHVYVVRGDVEVHPVPLVGRPPLTAAAPPPPAWGAPAADEVIDVDRLVKSLRTKTDPVRLAVIETTMKKSLNGAGIDFDVTNPLTAKVLAQSASQVTNIAETTRLNVMKTIKASYDEGLTIPDTATAIRAGMRDASPARARLIARTELAGAVNGGSLAATQIVSDATGLQYDKEWMTAPGAPNPRHELVDGLDGQTVPLDGMFDVEGEQLEFPGDPNGSPENVCNCRCTMSYVEPGGHVVEAGDAESGIVAPEDIAAEEGGDVGDLGGVGGVVPNDLGPIDAAPAEPAPIDLSGGVKVAPIDYTNLTDGRATEMLDSDYEAWGKTLTKDETDSLWAYRMNEGYSKVNRALREGTSLDEQIKLEKAATPGKGGIGGTYSPSSATVKVADVVKEIDSAIEKSPGIRAPVQTTVFRGVRDINDVFGPGGPKVGDVFQEKAYVSTTTERDVAENYTLSEYPKGTEGLIQIELPSGQKGAWLGAVEKGFDPSNRELLLPRGMKFEVTKVEKTVSDFSGDPLTVTTVRVVDRKVVEEKSRHVVVERETVEQSKGPKLSDDVYVASLQKELYSTNNVINYMNRKVKAGTASVEDRHRLEALRKRKEDVRALIAAPDPKGELSRVRNQINYMKRKVRDGSANHETHVRLGILEARAKELAALGKGDAGKIVKDTHAELKRINDEADAALGRAEAKRVQDARAREAEQAKAAVSYSSPTGVASLLIDKPIGTVIELPAHDIFMGMDAYKMGKSFAWIDKSGVVVKREADSAHDTATGFSQKDAEQTAAAYLESVPESMQGELQMITLARGYSPNDAYFQRTYKGFTHAAAQGGDGQMWFWQGYKTTFRRPSFDHEMGHIVGDDSGPRDVSEWSRAQTADQKTGEKMAEANLHNAYRRVLVGQRAVTEYGSNNNMEDWAESVRLWLESRREGRIAYKTDYATGQVKDLTFADVFPARARILDREFGP